jgi:hypothetical protein
MSKNNFYYPHFVLKSLQKTIQTSLLHTAFTYFWSNWCQKNNFYYHHFVLQTLQKLFKHLFLTILSHIFDQIDVKKTIFIIIILFLNHCKNYLNISSSQYFHIFLIKLMSKKQFLLSSFCSSNIAKTI